MLSVRDLSVRFGALLAVDSVSLELAQGRVLAVLGPSGCGKSTLLRAVAGLEPLASGTVSCAGADLAGVPTHRRGFAMMFQDGQLFPHLDVAGNVAYSLARQGLRGAQARAEVARLLALVGLDGYAARRPATLSGGEAQRVALARSLAARPRLLLLDEPLSALDRSLRERLALDLRRVLGEAGTTALLVTHDHDEAFTVADDTAVMRAGRIVQHGPTTQLWRHPVDPETALFLGYERVLAGAAARAALAGLPDGRPAASAGSPRPDREPQVAVRPDALVVDGSGPLAGRIVDVRPTPDGARVTVAVDGIGELSGRCEGVLAEVGAGVRARLDPSGVAAISTPG